MAEEDKSFRHLFSFGGAKASAPILAPPDAAESGTPGKRAVPEPLLAPPRRPRAPTHDSAAVEEHVDDDALSDPEDGNEELLKTAKNFSRGERTEDEIRTHWFAGGRQERLRADFKTARRNRGKVRTKRSDGG